ncbi:hypothetical protein DM811_01380 [Blattabacterium punctulatus]|uniref:DUF4296 domain-containing protein n=1 Tax=Blattabacterium punctulatus TaxID=164514 RepID=UPI000D7BA768|nr:DUF4296 domain-containing protein [Blattabacterium punctulatus]AWU42629.1 hypothetical protein DM811_01380 [Blattabacterium punctulatus]
MIQIRKFTKKERIRKQLLISIKKLFFHKKIIFLLFFFIYSDNSIPISIFISKKNMINILTEIFFLQNFFFHKKPEVDLIYKKYNLTEKKFLYNYHFYTKKIENHIDILKKVQYNLKIFFLKSLLKNIKA